MVAKPPTGVEFPYDLAERICRTLAKEQIGLFAKFKDVDTDDLEQIGLAGAIKDWLKYDPAKSAPSTFIYQSAWRDIQDAYRLRTRRHPREKRIVSVIDSDTLEASTDTQISLIARIEQWAAEAEGVTTDWLKDLIRKTEKAYPVRPKRGRGNPGYTFGAYVGCIAIMKRLNLSTRGMVKYLEERKDLARHLGFLYWIPSHNFFQQCRQRLEIGFEAVQ